MAFVGYNAGGGGSRSRWFHWDSSMTYPSGCNMTLGSFQPLTEMNSLQVVLLLDEVRRCVGLTKLPPFCAECIKFLEVSNSWRSTGLFQPVMGLIDLQLDSGPCSPEASRS
jgi:hypothetical protein